MADRAQKDAFCRDCFALPEPGDARCPSCNSPRIIRHNELFSLSIAHIDCDAFYAAIEKRDDPSLTDKPVIIGGGKRGVVSTACYIARIAGVRSAMPMFKARKLCPDAVVIRSDMKKYAQAGREIRRLMRELTPLVEPLSIDEAFLDLSGTSRLLKNPPALSLAHLTRRIKQEVGIHVSVGLSHNKFLAKIASDLDKPRGFAVIGKAETDAFLLEKPVGIIWGVGAAMQKSLAKRGIHTIAQLRRFQKPELMREFGTMGARLYHLARGEDTRKVVPTSATKSISNETTFFDPVSDRQELERCLWKLCENVSRRAKAKRLGGRTVTLKLKTAAFKTRSRSTSLIDATLMAERMFAAARPLLQREVDGTAFRLLGIGISHLEKLDLAEATNDLDENLIRQSKAELAIDELRARYGNTAVAKGRGFTSTLRRSEPKSSDMK